MWALAFNGHCVCVCVNAYTIDCGVLATIEQWYPTRKFNGTMVPHKRNSKVWPGLVTKEKTMKYPTSAICTVYLHAYSVPCGDRGQKKKTKNKRSPQENSKDLRVFTRNFVHKVYRVFLS